MAITLTGPNGDRHVPDGKPYQLAKGERVTGSTKETRLDVLDHIGKKQKTGVGDLLNRITTETGFKHWWRKYNRGQCMPCQRRQAALNYFKFRGPDWLHNWVEGTQEDNMPWEGTLEEQLHRELRTAGEEKK